MVKLEELYKVIHIIKEIKLDKNVNGIIIDRDLLLELNKLYEEQFNDIMELNNILIEKNSEIIKLLEENSNLQESYETYAEAKYYDFIDNHKCKLKRIKKYILNKMYLEDNKEIIQVYNDILKVLGDNNE